MYSHFIFQVLVLIIICTLICFNLWHLGTWEHRARMLEMAKTEQEASKMTDEAEGKHHIGDFLPPEELNKFMNKYKVQLLLPFV